MSYKVCYSGITHAGKIRKNNQDNYVCNGEIMPFGCGCREKYSFNGHFKQGDICLAGIFDGMGGEECGDIAARIAAECAQKSMLIGDSPQELINVCKTANAEICRYAAQNNVSSMGTTAALMEFTGKEIFVCNVGDTKIFRLSGSKIEQISKDHLAVAPYGVKPPLSQNLGIDPSEMIIEPYVSTGSYKKDDIYLICSDGLTDMVSEDEICQVIKDKIFDEMAEELLNRALMNGGKDNITIVLCKIDEVNL